MFSELFLLQKGKGIRQITAQENADKMQIGRDVL